jgi:outer membrane protein assembly factor BamE (lipoprotein component of BamABCDE complex)
LTPSAHACFNFVALEAPMCTTRCFVLLIGAIALAGCATESQSPNQQVAARIRPGVTTQPQIRSWLGEPSSLDQQGSGESRWGYESGRPVVDSGLVSSVLSDVGQAVGYSAPSSAREVMTSKSSQTTDFLEVDFDARGIVKHFHFGKRRTSGY